MLPVPPPRIPELGVPYPCTRIHSKGIAPVLVGYSTQFPGISFSCNYGPDVTICVSPAIGSLFQEACYVGIEIRKERRFLPSRLLAELFRGSFFAHPARPAPVQLGSLK